jgi:hypothetical protein
VINQKIIYMIKPLLSIAALIVIFFSNAVGQTNLNFEQWTGNTPTGWTSPLSLLAGGSVSKESTAPGEGSASAKLTTINCSICGILGFPDTIGGIIQQQVAFNQSITSVDVMLKSNVPVGDTASFILQSYSGYDPALGTGTPVGISGYRIPGGLGSTNWQVINLPYQVINANLTLDTILIVAASSDGIFFGNREGVLGSLLYIDAIVINTPVGAIELSPISKTFVSPNPAGSSVSIYTSNTNVGSDLIILDALGRKVYQSKITSVKETLDLVDFKEGIYFYEINKLDGTRDVGKFVVAK